MTKFISRFSIILSCIVVFALSAHAQKTTSSSEKIQLVQGGRCQAITLKGAQCKRMAAAGSSYCWQHKSNSKTTKATDKKESTTNTPSTTKASTGSSKAIQTGPRGGQYYINKNGNKTYIKRK